MDAMTETLTPAVQLAPRDADAVDVLVVDVVNDVAVPVRAPEFFRQVDPGQSHIRLMVSRVALGELVVQPGGVPQVAARIGQGM